MVRKFLTLVLSLSLITIGIPASYAASVLTLNIKKTPTLGEPKVTLYGQIKPASSNTMVKIEVKLNGKWGKTSLATKTKLGGS